MTTYEAVLRLEAVEDYDGEPFDAVDRVGKVLAETGSRYRVVNELHGDEFIAVVEEDENAD